MKARKIDDDTIVFALSERDAALLYVLCGFDISVPETVVAVLKQQTAYDPGTDGLDIARENVGNLLTKLRTVCWWNLKPTTPSTAILFERDPDGNS